MPKRDFKIEKQQEVYGFHDCLNFVDFILAKIIELRKGLREWGYK